MTRENKELLLQDLCARLPYKIRCSYYDICLSAHCNGEIYGIENKEYAIVDGRCIAIEFIKPYLFPLSSMTEEQKRKYNSLRDFVPTYHYEYGDIVEDTELYDNWESIDYLIANHFDYRGLIDMGLAIDATGLKVY